MPHSSEAASNKCFSAILSRLLCSGGLPTHPSDQFNESSSVKLEKCLEPEESESVMKRGSTTPGVVARLMGLDSFPAAAAPPKERTLGDFFRSKSVNSIDFLSHFDPVKHGSRLHHRRVRTSVSFREGLSVSDEFTNVVLLFEEELQEEKRKNREDFHGKRSVNAKNMEIQEKRKSVYRKKVEIEEKRKPVSEKKELQGKMRANLKEKRPVIMNGGLMKKKKKNNKILDHCDFKKIHPIPEVARRASGKKHQQSEAAISQAESTCSNAAYAANNERKMKTSESFCRKKMVEEICMLSEEEVRENWVYGMELKFEDFEETCLLFGQEILQVLLEQFVDDLVLNFGQEIISNS